MTISKQLKAMSESYNNDITSRAAIQLIPIIGGPLDTIMAGYGAEIQTDRFYALIDALGRRLDKLEDATGIEVSEELFDLFRIATENSVRTRSDDKR